MNNSNILTNTVEQIEKDHIKQKLLLKKLKEANMGRNDYETTEIYKSKVMEKAISIKTH